MILIQDLSLPAPSACVVEIAGSYGARRCNTLGQTVMDGCREKRTLDLRWSRMEGEALQRLFSLLDSGTFFDLTYPDPVAGEKTITCFCVDRQAKVWHYTGQARWADVHVKLEER